MSDDLDGDLTPQQRADLRFGEWLVEQRRKHAVDKFLWFVIGAFIGASVSRILF